MGLLGHDFLKELRMDQGFTLRELSEKTGISHMQIKNIEDGTTMPGVDTLFDLCNGLNITVYHFFEHIGVNPNISSHINIVPKNAEDRKKHRGMAVQGFEPRIQ